MKPLVLLPATAMASVLALTGCGSLPSAGPAAPAPNSATAASPTSSGPAVSSASPPAAPTRSALTPSAATSSPAPRSTKSSGPAARPSARRAELPETLVFSARTVDGQAFDGASLQGEPVLLWFWAPWCPTCRGQIPQVQQLAKTYEGRLQVLGVGSLDDAAAIKRFAGAVPGITQLTDADGSVWRHFGVVEQSSFVVLDKRGTKIFSSGYGGGQELAERVAEVAGSA